MVAIWTTPGGSSPERRPTVGILKPLLSGVRSPKLFGAGSPNTAPKRRLVSGGILQRRQQKDERVNEDLTQEPRVVGVHRGMSRWGPFIPGAASGKHGARR